MQSVPVLIVDDDASIRRLIRKGLLRAGIECWEAGDGDEALERFAQPGGEEIRVVVSDVEMPNRDGLGLLDTLDPLHEHQSDGDRSDGDRQGRIAFLFLTGNPSSPRAREISRRGHPVLTKPFPIHQLMQRILGLLERPSGTGCDQLPDPMES